MKRGFGLNFGKILAPLLQVRQNGDQGLKFQGLHTYLGRSPTNAT